MRITLNGFYIYDPTLFNDALVPDNIERQYLIDKIIERDGDLFPYHQALPYLKRDITNWFNRNYAQFEKMMAALLADYNPIENYDRIEDGKDIRDIESNPGSTVTSESMVSAYDSGTYTPSDKSTTTGSGKDTSKDTFDHDLRVHGNIGVMTNQNMIEQELNLRKIDIYAEIARLFEKEFLIQVY